MAASKSWNIFHIDLKTEFLQRQFYGVNRYVVCQLPPEVGHPLYIAARVKDPAHDMNDAPRRWWNILDKALCSNGMVLTRADRCCYVMHSTQTCKRNWNNMCSHNSVVHMLSHLNRVCYHRETQHLRKCWIPLKEAQQQANPWQES